MIVVDRLEKEIVICQDLKTEKVYNIKIKYFKSTPKEGDVFVKKMGRYYFSEEETIKRREYIQNICSNIFE